MTPNESPGLTVRPMERSESPRVADLVRAVVAPLSYYTEEARAAEMAKYTPEKLEALAAEDGHAVLVAEREGEVVGFCISRYDDGVVWLAWFGVREDARGGGVAGALLSALERSTRLRGCHKIWCDTRTDNVRSQRVLERAGFTRICTITRHWYGQDFHLWEKLV